MSLENNYLQLLFNNAAFLLEQDLNSYEMHPVEEKYFREVINFFTSLSKNLESIESRKEISTENLTSFYAIPVVVSALDSNKIDFKDFKENYIELARYISDILSKYLDTKSMNQATKESLIKLFKYLGNQSAKYSKFEKCEYLETFDENKLIPVYA